MYLLRKQIERLEHLHSQTHTGGNSAAGITFEISEFMRILPDMIEGLRQIELENEKVTTVAPEITLN